MAKYIVFLSDKIKDRFSEKLLTKHIEHLSNLDKIGKLQLCGPFTDDDSAIQVLIADNFEDAKKIVSEDPFVEFGYYNSVEVKELIEANKTNNWLMKHPQTEDKRT